MNKAGGWGVGVYLRVGAYSKVGAYSNKYGKPLISPVAKQADQCRRQVKSESAIIRRLHYTRVASPQISVEAVWRHVI